MSDLKETLSLVHAMAPALPAHLAPILQEGDRLQQSIQAFLHDVAEKRSEATTHLAQLHTALSELREGTAEQHNHLELDTQAIESALQDCLHALEGDEGQLVHDAEAVGAAARSVEGHLSDDGSRVEAGEGEARQALAALDGAIQAGQAELDGAVHAAATEAQALEHAVEEAKTAVTAEIGNLRERMKSHLDEARGRVAQTVQKLHELGTHHEADIRAVAADLAGRKDHLLEEVRQQAQVDLRQRVEAAAVKVHESLARLTHAVEEAKTSSERAREDVHAQFEELKQAMPPLERAVESVKRAANDVGITWN